MIFLSYSWKDQLAAHRIDELLRDNGYNVWIDFRHLDPEIDITEQLDFAIRHCDLFLAVRAKNRDSSPWMAAESLMAKKYCKPIVRWMVVPNESNVFQQEHLALINQRRANERWKSGMA